jgi:hypothetical protein
MHKLNALLLAVICGTVLVTGTGCPATTNGNDAGNNEITPNDAGNNSPNDAGNNTPLDAGPNCVGDGGCYACPPTSYLQIINACTNAATVSKTPVVPMLYPDGGFPPLP